MAQTETDAATVSSFQAGGGFSVSGVLDLGLAVQKSSTDDQTLGDLSETAVRPSLRVHFVKQTRDVPLAISAGLSYGLHTVEGDALDRLGWEAKGRVITLSGAVSSRLSLTPALFLVPQAGVSRSSAKVTISDRFGGSVSEKDNSNYLDVSLAVCVTTAPKMFFLLQPQASFGENTTLGISAGFLFPN